MLARCSIALKEWAAVCQALAQGRQALIARKGGLHEGRQGFRVQHPAFWLYPTYLHEGEAELAPEAANLREAALALRPPAGELHLSQFAEVSRVIELCDENRIASLRGLHILSEQTLRARFHYKKPGLFILTVRVYNAPLPHILREEPAFAGCRSWVQLPRELPTGGAAPAMPEHEFSLAEEAIVRAAAG